METESPKASLGLPLESYSRNGSVRNDHEARQWLRQFEQLSTAAQSFSLQLDYQKLLDDIAFHGAEIIRADRVHVYSILDGDLKLDHVYPQGTHPTPPSADAHWAARYLRPKLSNEPPVGDASVRNSLCVPMIATQNRVVGVIEFLNKRSGGLFSDHDLRVATCLARVATSAVDRARLFDRIETWTRSMETLLSFNATVNQHLEPQEMVRQLVANVTGFLDADGGAAGIVFFADTVPVVECDSLFFDGRWYPFERQWKCKEGIPGMMLETEFPFLVNDYQNHPLADPFLVREFHIRSCICVPIKNAAEKVLGFFKLHRLAGKPEFTWQEAAFLESLGNTAAVAIENARLVQSLDRKNRQFKSLSEAHVRRLEEERKHIARELHDETGQVLIGLKLRLQVLSGLLNEDQQSAKQELDLLRAQVNDATAQLKDLAKRLRPPTLDELGFEATIRQLLAEFRKQVHFQLDFAYDESPQLAISSDGKIALYRIVQESLTNIIKHAHASHVTIRFFEESGVHKMIISDDGTGFEIDQSTSGLGLIGMHERIKMLGGQLSIRSKPGLGTTIEVIYG